MAPYLDTKRFHWVFFGDSFFYPFDNRDQTASTPDMGVYVPLQEKMLARYKKQMNVDALPANLAGYEDFVRSTMADNQKRGGVAVKFEAAYFRTLYFTDPRAKRPTQSIPSTIPAAFLPLRITACFKTTFSASWLIRPANLNCRCISIPPSASAIILVSAKAMS